MRQIIKDNDTLGKHNSTRLAYKIINDLIYFNDNEKGLRLYISSTIKVEVFKLTYNEIGHPSYIRTYKQLTSNLYIFELPDKLYKFIYYYPYY